MSSLLDEAVVDAKALKDAAMKNAESVIVERYSDKIKCAVNALLEQDDFSMDDLDAEMTTTDSALTNDLPLAATDGEKLCNCPEKDEEIEIDFGELENEMSNAAAVDGGVPHEVAAAELGLSDLMMEEDEIEQLVNEIEEELKVDLISAERGNGSLGTNETELALANDVAIAQLQDTQTKEELKNMKKSVEALKESIATVTAERDAFLAETKKYKNVLLALKEKVNEMSLFNAKLLYTNKVLRNGSSLNERQKDTIVDAISQAKTIQEAKTICNTLQSTAPRTTKRSSKSLSEVVAKKQSSTLLVRESKKRKENAEKTAEQIRMQKLAGINEK